MLFRSEFVRGWSIALATDMRKASPNQQDQFVRMARTDSSPVVRRYLASALQRVPQEAAWNLAEALAQHGEDREDRNLPWLLWQGVAPLIPNQLERGLNLARQTLLPQLSDSIWWYVSTLEGSGLQQAVTELGSLEGELLRRRLAGLVLALEARARDVGDVANTGNHRVVADVKSVQVKRAPIDVVAEGVRAHGSTAEDQHTIADLDTTDRKCVTATGASQGIPNFKTVLNFVTQKHNSG